MQFRTQFIAAVWDAFHETRWLWVLFSLLNRRTAFVYEIDVHWHTALKSWWNRSWLQLQRDKNCIELHDESRLCKRAINRHVYMVDISLKRTRGVGPSLLFEFFSHLHKILLSLTTTLGVAPSRPTVGLEGAVVDKADSIREKNENSLLTEQQTVL